MKKFYSRFLFALLLLVGLVACNDEQTTDDSTPPPLPTLAQLADTGEATTEEVAAAATSPVISEILVGAPGNNNYEYVELYNPTTQAIDLRGWTLLYQPPNQEPVELYRWSRRADVPGLGHYLLVRQDEEVGALGDGYFNSGLFKRGGLQLLNQEGVPVDQVGWDEAGADFFSGSPIPAAEDGQSYERAPGGPSGNGHNSQDNAADFSAAAPNPQNSGDTPTPLPDGFLQINLTNPETVTPGTEFEFTVTISNDSGQEATDLLVAIPIHPEFNVVDAPAGADIKADRVEYTVAELADGASSSQTITIATPFTYFSTTLPGYYVEANGLRSYGPVGQIALAGGSLPIASARGLDGATVTVEGVVTMYSGGFFAGGGTKFYVEDDSGGIQVYCPTGAVDDVQIGDRVQITGYIEIYRTSLEIIPCNEPDDVVVVEPGAELAPQVVTLPDATEAILLQGELITVRGTLTRLEEFSFSYEMDLVDEAGRTIFIYLDKLTEVEVENLEVGQQYEFSGIFEQWDGNFRLMPRRQSDLVAQHDPVVELRLTAPFAAPAGTTIDLRYGATNYTGETLTDVSFTFAPLNPGDAEEIWTIASLTPDATAVITYSLALPDTLSGTLTIPAPLASSLTAEQLSLPTDHTLFLGDGVPIWALQGDGLESPYNRATVTTSGVVTAIFPDLNGFWLQMASGDGESATSDGIFVLTENEPLTLVPLQTVLVTGRIREVAGQTTLDVAAAADVVVTGAVDTLPAAVELAPPADEAAAQLYYESLEGMLVQISSPARAVAPTTQYGEYALVRAESGVDRIYRAEDIGYLIFVDDGSTMVHADQTTLPYVIYSGDQVSDLVGPLAYTFGDFKIEPLAPPTIIPAEQALPVPLRLGANQFSIATFNVENLFDTDSPHPDDPPLPTQEEYANKLAKLSDAIITMGAPSILALQEVENIGVLEDLAAQPGLASFNYQAVLIEGDDSRGIDVAYLLRGDQVELLSAEALPAPEGVTSRPPLLLELQVTLDGGTVKLFVINNHFSSLAGGEEATEPRRTAQAAWNVNLLQEIQAREPDAYVAILGDLNSYYDSLPLDTLRAAGLVHVFEGNADADRLYSYIYLGESETLDHILVTPGLFALLADVEAIHINADFPVPFSGDPSAQRSSDHDPIVAIFTLPLP